VVEQGIGKVAFPHPDLDADPAPRDLMQHRVPATFQRTLGLPVENLSFECPPEHSRSINQVAAAATHQLAFETVRDVHDTP
jgi:hypothetical protein